MFVILMFAANKLSSDIHKGFVDAFQNGHLKEINFLSFKASKHTKQQDCLSLEHRARPWQCQERELFHGTLILLKEKFKISVDFICHPWQA